MREEFTKEKGFPEEIPQKISSRKTRWALPLPAVVLGMSLLIAAGATGCGPAPVPHENYEKALTATQEALPHGGPVENPFLTSTPLIIKPTSTSVPPTETPPPTPTEIVIKTENILPEYSVYYGQMKQETGSGKGSVVIANIPGNPNKIYAFFEADRTGNGRLYEINSSDTNSMEAGGIIKITVINSKKISGHLEKFGASQDIPWVFEIDQYGEGKSDLIDATKRLWAKEMANSPNDWKNVPDSTIQLVGFRNIELPN